MFFLLYIYFGKDSGVFTHETSDGCKWEGSVIGRILGAVWAKFERPTIGARSPLLRIIVKERFGGGCSPPVGLKVEPALLLGI